MLRPSSRSSLPFVKVGFETPASDAAALCAAARPITSPEARGLCSVSRLTISPDTASISYSYVVCRS